MSALRPIYPSSIKKDEIFKAARREFGFPGLRPGQEEAIRAVVEGQDTLVVQPTGSGKSAIYQIAGSIIEGTTVVISPLIALQKDQIDSINCHHTREAVVVNSTQRAAETKNAFSKFEGGKCEYVFLAPEQFHKRETMERLKHGGVSLFVIDEAHCITEWGHDFRPDYLQIGPAIERLGHPVVLAMTATASPEVRKEIVHRLGMRKPKLFVQGFDRPNIHLSVDNFSSKAEKTETLVHRVRWAEKPGIVYVSTRANAEKIMGLLDGVDIPTLFYHGGLKAKERHEVQERFMGGDAEVIVATNAFGMGIDKADARFVYHHDVPDSLDSYYQEIGRAGRDGEKAEAVLFFREEDLGVQKFRSGEATISASEVEKVAGLISQEKEPADPEQIFKQAKLSSRKLTKILHRLEDVGVVEVLPTGEVELRKEVDIGAAAQAAADEQTRRKELKKGRLRQMQEYADMSGCRRTHLLHYFGDGFTGPCNSCDNCERGEAGAAAVRGGTRREVV